MSSDIGESLYLPGAASLAEQIDSRILIVLRDGRTLMGVLRSFDQYINLVLEETIERVTYEDKYCDIPLGLFLVRGDNLILLGDVDDEKEANQKLVKVTPAELSELLATGASKKQVEWDFE